MARQNSSVRRVRPRRKSKGFKVVPNSLTWRWSGNPSVIESGEPWYCSNVIFRHSLVIALFTRRVELCSLHSSPVADWRECRFQKVPEIFGDRSPPVQHERGVGGVSLLPGRGFILTFLSALWNDIKYPWYHSALLPVWYHQAGVLKLEIETCSKAAAPSSAAGEAAGCADLMAWSERFNYLILLSVPMPVSDFRVRRCEFSACIQTDWRCDAVCEWRVNLECAEAVGWIYQLLSRHLYQKVFSAFFAVFFF